MSGISRPILWKASPARTEIAIISECNDGEQSLAQRYLQIPPDSTYIPPAVPDICTLAIKVVQVLEQLHSKRVRHGSLRPDVIGVWYINEEPHVCLRDFTESRLLGDIETPIEASPADELLSLNTTLNGCLHYLPPEILSGNRGTFCSENSLMVVDHRSDFYSLGCILHHLLTGKPIFAEHLKGETNMSEAALEIAAAHRYRSPDPPTAGRDPLLDQLVLQLLAKEPTNRYRTGIQTVVLDLTSLEKGLIHDLRAIGNGTAASDPAFTIGEVDQAARFTFPRSINHYSFILI